MQPVKNTHGAFRYAIDCYGTLDGAAAELFRILAMDARSFKALKTSVIDWRPGVPTPCASHCKHSMRPEFEEQWTTLVVFVLALLRAKMRAPGACAQILMNGVRARAWAVLAVSVACPYASCAMHIADCMRASAGWHVASLASDTATQCVVQKPGVVRTVQQAAAVVALGEWIAVDCCMARVSGAVLDGLSGRRLFLESDSALIPGHDAHDEEHSKDDLGGSWLLRLCREWWESAGLQALQGDVDLTMEEMEKA